MDHINRSNVDQCPLEYLHEYQHCFKAECSIWIPQCLNAALLSQFIFTSICEVWPEPKFTKF